MSSFIELCTEAFEDDTDATEEQINEEVAPIRLVVTHSLLSRTLTSGVHVFLVI